MFHSARKTGGGVRRAWRWLSLVGWIVLASCSARQGTLITRELVSPALRGNVLGVADRQEMAIYLPPSYHGSDRRYPVLYLLPNFNTCLWRYTGGSYQGFHLRETMDELIRQGTVREMLVVIPNTVHMLGGSCYRNSPLTGNWEDYVVHDVVAHMDRHFRTIPEAGARALTGHGMGGTGALEIALKHPGVFSCVYAMSPALFDKDGLRDAGMIGDRQLGNWQRGLEQWKDLNETPRRRQFRDFIQTRINSPSRERYFEGLFVSYAAAVSPDLNLPFPHIAFPKSNRPNPANDPLIARFENGFGGWRDKVAQYTAKGRSLHTVVIEHGGEGEYPWIPRGAESLARQMREMGVTCELVAHEGGHESRLGWRMKTAMLPAISQALRVQP